MSKKNNKNRGKAYAEHLKEAERLEEERRKEKQAKRDTNRLTNTIVDEINEISLNLEKEDRMAVDDKMDSKKRPKVKAKKQKTH